MPLSIAIPLLGSHGDTRDAVVSILVEEHPLTAKEIHSRAKATGKNVTYQAVHKAIKQLETDKIVFSINRKYQLSPEWIDKLSSFAEELTKSKHGINSPKLAQTPTTVTVRNMLELGQLAIRFSEQTYFSGAGPSKSDTAIAHWRHTWPGLFMVEKEFERLQKIFTIPHFILIRGNNALDKLLAKPLTDMGAKVMLGKNCADTNDLVIHKQSIMYIHYPSALTSALDAEYKKSEKNPDEALIGLQRIVHQEFGPITITIVQNQALADQITLETKNQFK